MSAPDDVTFEEEVYIPISSRPEWQDVTPLPSPTPDHPVVHIAADPAHQDLLGYFWAGVAAGEHSRRMLDLTEEIILEFNSAHYTVWEWRWRCVHALGGVGEGDGPAAAALAAGEIALMRRVASDNPKNYQLWNYRRKFALARGAAHWREESQFSEASLAVDAKNYHAWAHRQAVALAFRTEAALWAEEVALTTRLLEDDIRNNSAWSQRLFILENAGTADLSYDEEVEYAVQALRTAAHNESAWEYLRGLAQSSTAPPAALAGESRIKAACCAALATDPSNAPATVLLADCCMAQAALVRAAGSGGAEAAAAEAGMLRSATALFERAEVADPMRAAYYALRQSEIHAQTP